MPRKIKIIADNKIPFLKGVLEPFAYIDYLAGNEITNVKVIDADVLVIRTRTKCDKELLDNSSVKLITTATIGFDHIDTDYCEKNNVKWVNAPGCNSTSVMQYITAILLKFAQNKSFSLKDKTIGIVGVGNVGRKIKKISKILGMKVLLNDPPRERGEGPKEFCTLKRIQRESDIITFHVPLNKNGIDKTFNLADKDFFNGLAMKPIVINTSRGEVIDTTALKYAINEKLVTNVALDVWGNEPEIDTKLMDLVDIATPHIAGYSADGKANGTSVCVNEISSFFDLNLPVGWYPENIPDAENGNQISIDGKNNNVQQILADVVEATYQVMLDDENLRNNPTSFEKLRGDYRIRREFHNYEVRANNCNSSLVEKLIKMNFNIKCN